MLRKAAMTASVPLLTENALFDITTAFAGAAGTRGGEGLLIDKVWRAAYIEPVGAGVAR